MLKPQDILVSLKFLSPLVDDRSSYAALADSLGLSVAETHAAVGRAVRSGLLIPPVGRVEKLGGIRPSTAALDEVLGHALRYFFPARTGGMAIGTPTAGSAPPLSTQLAPTDAPPHVWPYPHGHARGVALEPLYRSAPVAALRDPALGEWLALADAIRLGAGRLAELARIEVHHRLRGFFHAAAA